MCAHETSYVYSHECVKSSCFDENLVRYLHIRVFWSFQHWSFQQCFQSLFVLVLHAVRNRTKIESGSFPMSLFLWSTVWCSLIILRMSWPATAVTLNSWPSWLWSHNSSPPLSPKPHCAMLENQVIWLYDLGFCFWTLDGIHRKIVFFGDDLKPVVDKFKSRGTKNLCAVVPGLFGGNQT